MTSRRGVLAGVAAGLVAPSALHAQDGGVIDLTQDFWPLYDAQRGEALALRSRDLARGPFAPSLEIRDQGATAAEIARWLPRFDPISDQVRAIRPRLSPLWAANLDRFSDTLPGYRRGNRARLILSRFGFVTKAARIRDEYDVMVGIDEAVRTGRTSDLDLSIALAVESFHAHHFYHNWRLLETTGNALWLDLWFEGLAYYCAQRMFPRATPAQILGDARLAQADIQELRATASEMLPIIDIVSVATTRKYFAGDGLGRAVALRMLEREGRARSLPDMVFIPMRAARDIILLELNALSV